MSETAPPAASKELAMPAIVTGAISLRAIEPADAEAGQRLSQAVSWLHRVEDWQLAIRLGHGIVVERAGEIIGTALWWPYGAGHATLGMIIVDPAHQGGGIGKRLMQALLDRTEGRSLMLNATEAGAPLYAKNGFVPCGSVRQYQGVVSAMAEPALPAGATLRPGGLVDLQSLATLDAAATGLDRVPLLRELLGFADGVVLERAGLPAGFSILRAFGRGFVIGPVVAADEADAWALTAYWLHRCQGRFARVDVPDLPGFEARLMEAGLPFVSGVVTMRRGEPPRPAGPWRRYGLVTQAFG